MEQSQNNQEEDLKVMINGNEYLYSSLTDEQKEYVQQVRDIDIQLDNLSFQHRQKIASKTYFMDELSKSLNSDK